MARQLVARAVLNRLTVDKVLGTARAARSRYEARHAQSRSSHPSLPVRPRKRRPGREDHAVSPDADTLCFSSRGTGLDASIRPGTAAVHAGQIRDADYSRAKASRPMVDPRSSRGLNEASYQVARHDRMAPSSATSVREERKA